MNLPIELKSAAMKRSFEDSNEWNNETQKLEKDLFGDVTQPAAKRRKKTIGNQSMFRIHGFVDCNFFATI